MDLGEVGCLSGAYPSPFTAGMFEAWRFDLPVQGPASDPDLPMPGSTSDLYDETLETHSTSSLHEESVDGMEEGNVKVVEQMVTSCLSAVRSNEPYEDMVKAANARIALVCKELGISNGEC